jgi:RNA polymerase sigma-70 factor, ECF subfamily
VSVQGVEQSREGFDAEAHRPELSAEDVSRVYGFVAARVANRADAADIAQQTLLLACAKRDSWRGQSYSAWLLAIARHLIADHYRAKKRFRFVDVDGLQEKDPALQARADSGSLHETSERLTSWIDGVTRRLRPEEQVAVLLADVYAYRDKDSAEVLRMSVPCFKLLLHGARERLKATTGSRALLTGNMTAPGEGAAEGYRHSNSRSRPGLRPFLGLEHRTGVTCPLGRPELLALRNRLQEGMKQMVGRLLSKLWPLLGLEGELEADFEVPLEDVSVLVQELATIL